MSVSIVQQTYASVTLCRLPVEALECLVEFVELKPVARLALTGRAGQEAVQLLLSPSHLTALQNWTGSIWRATLPALERLAEAVIAPPLAVTARRCLLDIMAEVARRQNRCRNRVRVLCFTRRPSQGAASSASAAVVNRSGGTGKVIVRFDFMCPRKHGALQPERGPPASYTRTWTSSDDHTLICSNCGRDQIEDDYMFLHCPRKGCCYDLCSRCAAALVQHLG
eukprot:TRINITY_DN21915_c0_g1_i2.p1 TRINITY_DN21915_c0_g1~~TRINITY_DN21915_c0_g1_i2.p1  ORF type:complete len:224 (-),score=32.75 TRINITY_DN21915_c0_g1_i2:113-784(-)